MQRDRSDSNSSGKESDFCAFLREVLAGRKPIDELLVRPEFKRRLLGRCRAHAQNDADADELYNDVSLKLSQVLLTHFQPDFSKEFGGFFAWLRTVTRNSFLDRIRPAKLPLGSERPEELVAKADPREDVERKALHNERVEKLVKCIERQPREIRLAAELYVLQGFSSAETVEKLARSGIVITPPTVRNWVRDALRPYFPEAIAFSDTELARQNKPAKPPEPKAPKTVSRAPAKEVARKENQPAKRSLERKAPKTESKAPAKEVTRKKNQPAKRPKPTAVMKKYAGDD
jgi:RNA polymerase sigma factor (sigma-70 family)